MALDLFEPNSYRSICRGTLEVGLSDTGYKAAPDMSLRRFHRAMTRPFFTKDRISHFDLFDRHAGDAIRQMQTRFAEGYPVDFQVSLPFLKLFSQTLTSSVGRRCPFHVGFCNGVPPWP